MNWVLMSIVILCIIAGVLYLILNRLEKCVNKYMAS